MVQLDCFDWACFPKPDGVWQARHVVALIKDYPCCLVQAADVRPYRHLWQIQLAAIDFSDSAVPPLPPGQPEFAQVRHKKGAFRHPNSALKPNP